tara:strand:+ start:72 stop:1430 length:1359 start_codon:yes stop_codon:yes gene_type:complete
MSNKVHYKGKSYKSIVEFYDSNKDEIEVSYQNVLKNFKDGLPAEEAIKKQPRKKVEAKQSTHGSFKIEGKEYPNLRLIAKEYDINENTLYQRFHRGKRDDELIPLNKRKNYIKPIKKINYRYEVEGKGFKSYDELSKHYGVKVVTIRTRLKRGLSLEEALGIVKTPDLRYKKNNTKKTTRSVKDVDLVVDGIKYDSISQLAKSFGLEPYVVRNRIIDYGYTAEEAVKKPLKGKSINVKGKEFSSIAEAARYFNKSAGTIQANLKRGLTVDEAFGFEKRRTSRTVLYDWNGKKYTIKELTKLLSKEYKIPQSILFSRIYQNKLSIEEAISLGSEKVVSSGRYNLTILKRDPELANKDTELYFVLIEKESKIFYKIGLTTRTTEERLIGENFKLLARNKGKLIDIYKQEQYLLNKYKNKKFGDQIEGYFDGKTETLSLNDSEVRQVLQYFESNK